METVTYPVRLERWVRPAGMRRCPVCNGRGWVTEPIRVFYRGKERREAAVTIDCYFCHGAKWISDGGTE